MVVGVVVVGVVVVGFVVIAVMVVGMMLLVIDCLGRRIGSVVNHSSSLMGVGLLSTFNAGLLFIFD